MKKKKIKHAELLEAVQTGKTKTVRRALEQGRSPNKSKQGDVYTLLQWAVQENHPQIVKILVKHGANCDAYRSGNPPLLEATWSASLDMVKLLLGLGADVNSTAKQPAPLNAAAGSGYNTIARFLLENGANVNAASKNHQPPLFSAIENLSLEMVELLLAFGANPDWRDKKGCNAADFAQKSAKKIRRQSKKHIAWADAVAARLVVSATTREVVVF